jgi:hypothetical protein
MTEFTARMPLECFRDSLRVVPLRARSGSGQP